MEKENKELREMMREIEDDMTWGGIDDVDQEEIKRYIKKRRLLEEKKEEKLQNNYKALLEEYERTGEEEKKRKRKNLEIGMQVDIDDLVEETYYSQFFESRGQYKDSLRKDFFE
ncbi:36569_t:CDS:2 [Gigaspora margarita]|uniref:36569_t:CDS:1 n=1 Tax=Gigaspora margarita TaxID=4874 RepID=A0ABN7V8U1_GIGMA|nr:36569_t:CDS:2 [Gigaspora margarita]